MNTLSILSRGAVALCAGALTLAVGASAAQARGVTCIVTEVGDFADRVHVKCKTPLFTDGAGNPIYYMAVDSSDASRAMRLIEIGNAALASGRTIAADLPDTNDLRLNTCRALDCRVPTSFGLGK